MAHYPIPEPEPDGLDAQPSAANRAREIPTRRRGLEPPSLEHELMELTAKFSSHEGGQLSTELSANLALEVVLYEIVEQACVATGASGAAVILERDGEWVCRASSGTGVPELGARLGCDSGLTAECIRSRQVQHCGDTEKDLRVDIEACRTLGVRSLIMLPILQAEKLIGVFAAFSPRLSAFGEEHERSLKIFSSYVLRSLALTSETPSIMEQMTKQMPPPERAAMVQIAIENPSMANLPDENKLEERLVSAATRNRFDSPPVSVPAEDRQWLTVATWIMAAVLLAFAVFLISVASQRLAGGKTTRKALPVQSQPRDDLANQRNEDRGEAIQVNSEAGRAGDTTGGRAGSADSATELGSLTVYENGKEVFHVPAAAEKGGRAAGVLTGERAAMPASGVHGQQIYQLSPEEAQREVLLRVEPVYPEQAREQGIQGIVVLNVRARRDGRIRDVRLVGGQPLLVEAAMTAVKQWQFRPHLIDGQPVETQSRITLIFNLPR